MTAGAAEWLSSALSDRYRIERELGAGGMTGAFEVYVRPLDREREEVRVSLAGGGEPVWGPDDREPFYRAREGSAIVLMAARLTFTPETSGRPFFRLLGTPTEPTEQKRQEIWEGGHYVPRTMQVAWSLAWLDRYLGPVAR